MGDTQDENNENIINTHLQEQEQDKEATTSPYVFNCSNPELGNIDWDIKEENITIDEELKQRKKKRTKEAQGFPPMFDDIVAGELLEEEEDVPALADQLPSESRPAIAVDVVDAAAQAIIVTCNLIELTLKPSC